MLTRDVFYYDQFGKIYDNKFEAIKSNNDIKFYFYDDFFLKQNWKIEPQQSLQQLYKERAQQIRDMYNYLVLCYSGGADSTQILETFYYNNIHIDEIIVVGALSQDSQRGVDDNHNGDLYHNVFPTLNSLSLPNTKISLYDYTEQFKDPSYYSLIKQYGCHYYKHIGTWTSPHNLFWHDLDKIFTRDKIGFIFGTEKPKVSYINKKFIATFMDSSLTDYGNRYDYGVGKRINFYTDPDAATLLIKQHHVVKNYFEENLINNIKVFNQFHTDYFSNVRPLIYNLKNPLSFESQKSKTTWLSARDKYILQKKDSEIYKIFQQSLVEMSKDLIISKRYSIPTREYQLN